jgi:hypothetical protein
MSGFTLPDGEVEHFIVGHLATTRHQVRTACGLLIPEFPHPSEGAPRCPDCADYVDAQAERDRQAERAHVARLRSADAARADQAEAAAIRRQADALDALMRRNARP